MSYGSIRKLLHDAARSYCETTGIIAEWEADPNATYARLIPGLALSYVVLLEEANDLADMAFRGELTLADRDGPTEWLKNESKTGKGTVTGEGRISEAVAETGMPIEHLNVKKKQC